jgi:hypothetical protein
MSLFIPFNMQGGLNGMDQPTYPLYSLHEEKDLQERSTKKMKDGEQTFSMHSSLPKDYSDVVHMQSEEDPGDSYKDMMLGRKGGVEREDRSEERVGEQGEDEEGEKMKVEEHKLGNYDCPAFVFSKSVEKRLYRPWRRSVIVKLLGRRIGYKALETRLQQMWVRKGVINIIDLSNDCYLVAFSHEDDQYSALMDGPWFIYDHYLTVKEWSPNFHPASDTIKEVAVWLRISGLPIEFYDSEILHYIGNRVGKTVKVDKNTLTHERGKYARLCVQVDLAKPLLAMFTIHGRKYNIEYEGLHLLCTACGRFGHYTEGCPNKVKEAVQTNVGQGVGNQSGGRNANTTESGGDGPWKVVQKTRINRKGNLGRNNMTANINALSAKVIAAPQSTGSRFDSLSEENQETDREGINGEEARNASDIEGGVIGEINGNTNGSQIKKLKNKSGSSAPVAKNGAVGPEYTGKVNKLATRGGGSFKNKTGVQGKSGVQGKKGVESVVDKMGVQIFGNLLGQADKPFRVPTQTFEGGWRSETGVVGSNQDIVLGPKAMTQPNVPRPPDWMVTPPIITTQPYSHQPNETMVMEGEVFEDANDQSSQASLDSDMEMVAETPRHEQ